MRDIFQIADEGVGMGVLIRHAQRLKEKRDAKHGEWTPWAQRLRDELKDGADEEELAEC